MHPINGEYSHWIDDKLTLKYICAGTELDRYMPDYYYMIDREGRIQGLMDCPEKKTEATAEDVADLLARKKTLAIKTIAGSLGIGFFKAECKADRWYLNGSAMDRAEFCKRISELRSYLIIEYLFPHPQMAEFSPDVINSIRYLMGRIDGKMKLIKSFVRFGTTASGFIENYNRGGILCYLDENGYFSGGNVNDQQTGRNRRLQNHPDTGKQLQGRIPLWDEIVGAAQLFDLHFPQLQYMGLDFVVTSENKVKVLEINSLTSLDCIELNDSILDSESGEFFRRRLPDRR